MEDDKQAREVQAAMYANLQLRRTRSTLEQGRSLAHNAELSTKSPAHRKRVSTFFTDELRPVKRAKAKIVEAKTLVPTGRSVKTSDPVASWHSVDMGLVDVGRRLARREPGKAGAFASSTAASAANVLSKLRSKSKGARSGNPNSIKGWQGHSSFRLSAVSLMDQISSLHLRDAASTILEENEEDGSRSEGEGISLHEVRRLVQEQHKGAPERRRWLKPWR